jgi:hypothetical protein
MVCSGGTSNRAWALARNRGAQQALLSQPHANNAHRERGNLEINSL